MLNLGCPEQGFPLGPKCSPQYRTTSWRRISICRFFTRPVPIVECAEWSVVHILLLEEVTPSINYTCFSAAVVFCRKYLRHMTVQLNEGSHIFTQSVCVRLKLKSLAGTTRDTFYLFLAVVIWLSTLTSSNRISCRNPGANKPMGWITTPLYSATSSQNGCWCFVYCICGQRQVEVEIPID